MSKIPYVRSELLRRIELAEAAGATVKPGGEFTDVFGSLCLLGAVVFKDETTQDQGDSRSRSAALLTITEPEAVALEIGFDGAKRGARTDWVERIRSRYQVPEGAYPEYEALGREFAELQMRKHPEKSS